MELAPLEPSDHLKHVRYEIRGPHWHVVPRN